jgi:HD-like signal output (HDOD) protein
MTQRKAAAERFADTLGQLQGSRGVARRVLALTSDPGFDLREVVGCLESDPALAAKTMRVVNSARYGLRQPVASIKQAAALLGQRSLRLFAVSFCLMDGLTKGPAAPLAAGFGRRAVLMASAAARLAKLNGKAAPDEAYTAGLLADVGVLIFAQYQPKIYLPAYDSCFHGPELVLAERELFDVAHPELGARFLSKWGLPSAVIAAIITHHDDAAMKLAAEVAGAEPPSADAGPLGPLLRAADLFAAAIVDPAQPRVRAAAGALRREFNVTDARPLAEQVLADLGDATELFGVTAPKTDSAAALAAFAESAGEPVGTSA